MNVWLSIYRKCQKDRIFYFRCHRIRNETYSEKFCSWTKPDSAVKQDMKFNCPRRGTITGMRSLFNESSSDRRVSFKCCISSEFAKPVKCLKTPYMNKFGGLLDYVVPHGYKLVGIRSKYSGNSSSSLSDRRWRFKICKRCEKSDDCKAG